MAVLHRALLTWFLGLVFLILLVIRLDQRSQWNWFIVFIPMWIFDGIVLIYATFIIISQFKSESRYLYTSFMSRKVHFVIIVLFKLILELLICLKLEVPSLNIPLYFVFIPLWCIFAYVTGRMVHSLVQSTSSSRPASKNEFSFFSRGGVDRMNSTTS